MPFRDLRGYQELMFGAYVRNAMLFATLPYYLAQKMSRGRFGSHASDVSEPRSSLSSDTALGRKRNREVLASLRIPRDSVLPGEGNALSLSA